MSTLGLSKGSAPNSPMPILHSQSESFPSFSATSVSPASANSVLKSVSTLVPSAFDHKLNAAESMLPLTSILPALAHPYSKPLPLYLLRKTGGYPYLVIPISIPTSAQTTSLMDNSE